MSKLTRDKIEYMVIMVNMFASHFRLSEVEAYHYISQYQGIELMDEFYDVMHTQSFPDMVDSLAKYCARNGGYLALVLMRKRREENNKRSLQKNDMKKIAVITLCLILLQGVTYVGLAQPAFKVHVDTLVLKGNEVVCGDYTFSCYKGDWHWTRNCPYPTLLFEDDLYTVNRDNEDVLFTEKKPSLYVDSQNGWPQYEQVNRQYYFTGKFHQILRHGDYYYLISPKQVDSLRIDQSPGNPLVRNRLPEIEGITTRISEWCDPVSGYGDDWFANWVYCIEGCCIGNVKYYLDPPSVDTFYRGAFIADDQLFHLIRHDNQTEIAKKAGGLLTSVLELGQGWIFYDLYDGLSRWWNLGSSDSRLIVPFSIADGPAGMLTIDGSDIHIRYIMSPTTVVP